MLLAEALVGLADDDCVGVCDCREGSGSHNLTVHCGSIHVEGEVAVRLSGRREWVTGGFQVGGGRSLWHTSAIHSGSHAPIVLWMST